MTQGLLDTAIDSFMGQRFAEALPLLCRVIDQDSSQWNVFYMAGQCCRALNDIDGAIDYLSHAAELKGDEPSVFLALGIAFQLSSQWGNAVAAFRRAIEIDPDFEVAYNSLALTQQLSGELEKSLHNYDAGAKALARRIAKALQNNRTSPIFKTRETIGRLWLENAIYAALYLTSCDEGIKSMAWPTGEQAMEEEDTETRAGLYWVDQLNDKSETVRLFLPNFFNTIRELLKCQPIYSILIHGRGTVLVTLGRHEEARQHFDEATEFNP